jgi:xanthine dehydrogenase accessory factor
VFYDPNGTLDHHHGTTSMIKAKLAAQVAKLSADRVPFVLATVVRAKRPTSVGPGDTAVVLADGTIEGFVGGQCAESSVRLYSLRALETGEPMLLRLIPGDADGAQPADGIEGVIIERNPCLSGGAIEIFLEPQLPLPQIVVFGDSPVARALADIAIAGGYDVVPTLTADESELRAATAVVVASHGNDEERVLTGALLAGIPYVALVASHKRGAAVRDSLDVPPELKAQIHTPAGVDIGAETPAEIAISILAELIVIQHAPTAAVPAGEQAATEPPASTSDDEAQPSANGHADAGDRNGSGARPKRGAATANEQPEDAAAQDGESEKGTTQKSPVADPLAALESETVNGGSPVEEGELPEGVEIAIDPVCGMKVAVTESTLHLDVADKRVYFCGTGCRLAYAAPQAPDAAKR